MTVNVDDRRSVSDSTIPVVRPSGLFEMTLEVSDLALSQRFYHDVIGLPIVDRWTDDRRAVWLGLGREGFLGLWPPETGGAVAIHGGRGGRHVHFALRLPMGTLDTVRVRIESLGYPVESWDFGNGNRAIYLDDPDGNVVELTERATLWDGTPATEGDVRQGRNGRFFGFSTQGRRHGMNRQPLNSMHADTEDFSWGRDPH